MLKSLNFILFLTLSSFIFFACSSRYPSYEEVQEGRTKIEPITFEKEKWFDKKGIGVEALWETRPGLARDLINRNLLIGKSFTEVKELLGEEEMSREDKSVSYTLYNESGFVDPIYIENLIVNFDENEKVKNAGIEIKMMDGHPDYR
jgi:hypothetical protein